MPTYKKIIFVKAIKVRVEAGEGSIDKIIDSYTKLSAEEQDVLRKEFPA